jgi:hypothetical protein
MSMNARCPIMFVFGVGLFIVAGCAGPPIEKAPARSTDPVLSMLHQGIIELDESIEELNQHIADLQEMPPSSDGNIQELYALDLAAWKLHLQQRILQRDHLVFVVDQIQRVRQHPQEKSAAASEWAERRQNYVKILDAVLAHKQELERKRFDLESHVVGQYFQQ